TARFFFWMEAHNIRRSAGAELLGVDERSLSTYRSRGLPKKKMALAERLMTEGISSVQRAEPEDNRINITFTDEEFNLVQRAADLLQIRFKDFIRRAAIARAEEEIRKTAPPEP